MFDRRMETGYASAIAWSKKHHNTRMLETLYAGLESHRRWMREGR